ncbi:Enolase [Hondaea fermentalgiana]|uniref:Enolase n=1 Tax=Hondaea fermentalgiana TaxID=2315210 RepID=A0A2R5G3Q0_9STRA|nr:Enolase [Hondaea fermentalgiana]|eukprot:GBG25667.1 Enolase [Hondaea fermentalgiana]
MLGARLARAGGRGAALAAAAQKAAQGRGPRGARAFSVRLLGARGRETGRQGEIEVAVETSAGDHTVTVREANPARAAEALEGEISRLINGLDPTDQRGVDSLLCQMDGTADRSEFTPGAILGVSVATAIAGAHAADLKLFVHLAKLAGKSTLRMPMPISTLPSLPMVSMIPFGDTCLRNAIDRFRVILQDVKVAADGPELSPKAQLRALMRPLKSRDMLGEVALGLHVDADTDREKVAEFMNKFPLAMLQLKDTEETEAESLTAALGEELQIFGGLELYQSLDAITYALQNEIVNSVIVDPDSLGTVSAVIDAGNLVDQAPGVATLLWDTHLQADSMQEFLAHLALSQCIAAVSVADIDGPFAKELCSLEALLNPTSPPE